MSPVETAPKDRGTVLAEERTDLAFERTIIAAERTLMAWIRTALSMIGFGFSIYKFFQYQAEEIAAGNIQRPQAPRNLGLTLIALGTLALSAAAWQHRNFLNSWAPTRRGMCGPFPSWSRWRHPDWIVTFYGVLLRHGPF